MQPYFNNGVVRLFQSDARSLPLEDGGVHCVVTSPPYFGLRRYADVGEQGIGLEPTVAEYIANLVECFREVRRVLRDDGVLWLNIDDSYGGGGGAPGSPKQSRNKGSTEVGPRVSEFEQGNRLGVPERLVLALQADGWTWRDTVIWVKPNPMPESVHGWFFTRHRVIIKHHAHLSSMPTAAVSRSSKGDSHLSPMQTEQEIRASTPIPSDRDGQNRSSEIWAERERQGESAPISEYGESEIDSEPSTGAAHPSEPREVSRNLAQRKQVPGTQGSGAEISQDSQQSHQKDSLQPPFQDFPQGASVSGTKWSETPLEALDDRLYLDSGGMDCHQGSARAQMSLLSSQDGATHDGPRDSFEQGREAYQGECGASVPELQQSEGNSTLETRLIDCPGCAKCEQNGGYVLRKGSWRTTGSFEYLYMLTKGMSYYSDGEAVKERAIHEGHLVRATGHKAKNALGGDDINDHRTRLGFTEHDTLVTNRNKRSVWTITPEPYGGEHYATFPQALVEPCILASTSERGCCPRCGACWARVIKMTPEYETLLQQEDAWTSEKGKPQPDTKRQPKGHPAQVPAKNITLSWRPTCSCLSARWGLPLGPVPCLTLDPFCGTGTVQLVSQKLGRRSVGIDLSDTYLAQAVARLQALSLPMPLVPDA